MKKDEINRLERLVRIVAYICRVPVGDIFPNGRRAGVGRLVFLFCVYKLGLERRATSDFLGIKSLNWQRVRKLEFDIEAEQIIAYAKKVFALEKRTVVYLAGKVSNQARNSVEKKFRQAEKHLVKLGYVVLNPIEIVPQTASWGTAMRTLLPYLAYCDAICLLPDWEESEGAKLEYEIARKIGLEILFYKELQNGEHN